MTKGRRTGAMCQEETPRETGTEATETSLGHRQSNGREPIFADNRVGDGTHESGQREEWHGQSKQDEQIRWARVLELRSRIQAGIYEVPPGQVVAKWLAAECSSAQSEAGL